MIYELCFILFPLVILAEEKISPAQLEIRLMQFFDFVDDLHTQGLLDGEILVARDQQILLHLRSEEIASADSPNEPQFMIGSVSKQFFAVALLKCLYETSPWKTEELKIADVQAKLHAPLSFFLPREAPIWGGDIPEWAHQISLHHLLTHTSGIPNYTDSKYEYSEIVDSSKYWFEFPHSTDEIIRMISNEPLLFSPGSQHSYSNTGYVLIAEVIESITLLPVSQYLQEALFNQLDLFSTSNPMHGKWNDFKQHHLSCIIPPFKYDPRGDQMEIYPALHCEDVSIAKGSGSIISSSMDLLKWNQALHKDRIILPEELYRLLITDNMDNYGYGIGIEFPEMGVIFGHSGRIGSYQTLLLYTPEYDLSIIVLSHICYDFDQIEEELQEIEKLLQETIPDEKERDQKAFQIILEKYPHTRGFERILEKINQLFYH